MNRDWTDLPPDLLGFITSKFTSFFDILSFKGVCSSWRYSANRRNKKDFSMLVSFGESSLTITDRQNYGDDDPPYKINKYDGVLCISIDLKMQNELRKANPCYHKMIGSHPEGWLIMLDGSKNPYLIQLFPRTRIDLPRKMLWTKKPRKFYDQEIYKAILLGDNPSHLVVIILFHENLSYNEVAIWRTGDREWTCLEDSNYIDIAFCDNKPYALRTDNKYSHVESLEFSIDSGKRLSIRLPHLWYSGACPDDHRLVSLSKGEVLVVSCCHWGKCSIWKVNLHEEQCVKVSSLDGNTLILGDVASAFVLASNVENHGYKPNSVYVVRNSNNRIMNGYDCFITLNVYNLEDGKVDLLWNSKVDHYWYQNSYCSGTQRIYSHPHQFELLHLFC